MIEAITSQLQATKKASYSLGFMDEETQSNVLLNLANRLRNSTHELVDENKKDLALMKTL